WHFRKPLPMTSTDHSAQIDRINELISTGRAQWIGLLAYLAFTFVTVLGVEDVDFFVPSRETDLPLIGVSIPTFSFFIFAPALGSALYIYLHLHILKLADALSPANIPSRVQGRRLEDHLKSWLLVDLILMLRRDDAYKRRPLDPLAGLAVFFLVWFAGIYVLGHMTVVSWPAHDWRLSWGLGLATVLSLIAGLLSWVRVWRAVRVRRWIWLKNFGLAVVLLTVSGAGLVLNDIKSRSIPLSFLSMTLQPIADLPPNDNTDPWYLQLSRANFSGVTLSTLPEENQNYLTTRHRFRLDYCNRRGIGAEVCGRTPSSRYDPPPFEDALRMAWCADRDGLLETPACIQFFTKLNRDMTREWRGYRNNQLIALDKPDLSNADLRGANLVAAKLPGISLEGAILVGAVLRRAQMEGANLWGAQMKGAILFGAQMEGANLFEAQMEGADLREAQMEGADLFEAQMEGANLRGAQMEGANLRGAQMTSVLWSGAALRGALFHDTVLTDARDLTQTQLDGAVGNAGTVLPVATAGEPPFRIASCWDADNLPPTLDQTVEQGELFFPGSFNQFRASLICSDTNPKQIFTGPVANP
ncbi:MAG: pentapeptide repeat-containing protein, partial [Pseudomonadota bacterium]